ncbi:hypothetical protein [Halopiger goleimassiliensis]|uniref:hypothetical protein n=1 Tax=Halopiger goleimassiliensis TaxID=1293048 RepID=UPI001E2B5158|nr:hypothetical protein [Halopiger goleimassiliensis]
MGIPHKVEGTTVVVNTTSLFSLQRDFLLLIFPITHELSHPVTFAFLSDFWYWSDEVRPVPEIGVKRRNSGVENPNDDRRIGDEPSRGFVNKEIAFTTTDNALYSLKTRSLDEDTDDSALDATTSEAETKDTQEVLNYEQAIDEGIETLDSGGEISVDLLHDLHKTLLTDVPEDRIETDTIGAYKTVPNHLGKFYAERCLRYAAND